MREACKKIQEKIESKGGKFNLKKEPFVVGKNHERELAADLMKISLQEEGEEFEFED